MKKFIKLFSVLMIVSASLMVGLSSNYQEKQNDVSLRNLITLPSANAEEFGDDWALGCIPCSGGVIFMCIPTPGAGCFNLPCSGGYC